MPANAFRIIVTGDKELAERLGRLGRSASVAAKQAMLGVAGKMVALAKQNSPIGGDDDGLGGHLRDSIRHTRGTIKRNGNVIVTVIAGGDPLKPFLKGRKANVYAIVQHEDLTLKHDEGGPKFLERPVFQLAPEIPGAIEAALAPHLQEV